MNKAHHPTVFSGLSKLEDHRNFIYTAGNSTGVVGYGLCTSMYCDYNARHYNLPAEQEDKAVA